MRVAELSQFLTPQEKRDSKQRIFDLLLHYGHTPTTLSEDGDEI